MSTTWQAVTARIGRRRARWARALRLGGTGLLLSLGAGLLVAWGIDHSAPSWRLALPCLAVGATWQLWYAPEHHLPEALRLRRLSRKVALRLGSLPLLAASLLLPAHLSGAAVPWLLAAAPVPVVLEALLWRFAPSGLRRDVRAGLIAEELMTLGQRVTQPRPLVFAPELGAYGRPVPQYQAGPPPAASSQRYLVTPRRELVPRPAEGGLTPAEERWLRTSSIQWSGRELSFTDGRGRRTRQQDLPGRPAELVLFSEHSAADKSTEHQVFLLDAEGRRLLTLPGLGQDRHRLRGIADAAGLRYSEHRIAVLGRILEVPLSPRLFPRLRGHRKLRIR